MGGTRAPLTNQDLEYKYRKAAFFINKGCDRIVRLEQCLKAICSRLKATEDALVWVLEHCPPDPDKPNIEVLRDQSKLVHRCAPHRHLS